MADMPYFRFVYLDEDEKAAREYPRAVADVGCATWPPTGAP